MSAPASPVEMSPADAQPALAANAGEPFAWGEERCAPLILETPRQASARRWLMEQPAWGSTRQNLSEALRSIDGVIFAQSIAQARALGLWDAAQADLSWVCETFARGSLEAPHSRRGFSVFNFVERAQAFHSMGFDWPTLGPRVLAHCAALLTQAINLHPGPLSLSRWHPDGGEIKQTDASHLASVCARALIFPFGFSPRTLARLQMNNPPDADRETVEILCAAAAGRFFSPQDSTQKVFFLKKFAEQALSAPLPRDGAQVELPDAIARIRAPLETAIERESALFERMAMEAEIRSIPLSLGELPASTAGTDKSRHARRV